MKRKEMKIEVTRFRRYPIAIVFLAAEKNNCRAKNIVKGIRIVLRLEARRN